MNDLDAFETHLRNRGLSEGTIATYCKIVARIPDGEDPEDWLLDQVDASTPIGTRASLRGAVVNLVRFQTGDDQTRLEVALPRVRKTVKYGRDALSETDAERFELLVDESSTPEPSRTILLLLCHTGLRISEMCGLRWSQVDLKGDPYPHVDVVGKGNKERWIPLTTTAKNILVRYRKGNEDARASSWVFPAARSEGPTTAAVVRNHLRDLRAIAPKGLQHVHPHVLRHTVATRLLAAEINLKTVQVILGHADIATTSIYLHPTHDMVAAAFAKL